MATNPGSWSSSSARQPRTPTHDPSASGLSSSHGVSLGSSKLYYRASEGLNSKSENGTQSISTPQSSLSSSNTSSSPPYSHKFESAASGSPYPSLPPGSSFSTSQGPASLRGPFSSLSLEQAPASLPAKLISNGNTHSPVAYDLSHTSSETSTTAQNAVSGDDQSSTTFSYDLSSSNIILPRGTIRPATVHPAVSQTGARSASSPVLIATPPPRPASLSAAELAPKSEKSRKFKKTNVSSLPAAPPSSSIASVPVAEGNVQMAELITNRWPDALYQGWMKKRNKGKESTAKKRYLVIKTNCIEYYSDPTSANPKGIIKFDDIAISFNECLRVYVKEKVWEFMAESERDLTRWHVVWRAVLSGLNKNSDPIYYSLQPHLFFQLNFKAFGSTYVVLRIDFGRLKEYQSPHSLTREIFQNSPFFTVMASNTPSTTVNAKVYGSAREQCWAARDAYHECLRNEGGDRKACENLYKVFTESCPASWVRHFEDKRNYYDAPRSR